MHELSRNIIPLIDGSKPHVLTRSPERSRWADMKSRCFNKNVAHYKYYGGRGITVCERWLLFDNFYADMGPLPSPKHSLDRINNDGNYEPENCRWANIFQQANNKRTNQILTHEGESRNVTEWAMIKGISPSTLFNRLANGWTTEKTLTTPSKHAGKKFLILNGETNYLAEWARRIGVNEHIVRQRIRLGWPTDRILTQPVRHKRSTKTLTQANLL